MYKNYLDKCFEKRDLVETFFPSHIACEYHQMLSVPDAAEKISKGISLFQRLLEHTYHYLLALYIELCENYPDFKNNKKIDKIIYSSFNRMSLGIMLKIVRELIQHLRSQNSLGLLKPLESFDKISKNFDKLLFFRNRTAHDLVSSDDLQEIFSNILVCIEYFAFLKETEIFVPSTRNIDGSYSGYLFSGCAGTPLFIETKPNNFKLELYSVYLTTKDYNIFIQLDPFFKYVYDKNKKVSKHHLCLVNIKNKNAHLLDYCSGYSIVDKSVTEEYIKKIKILSPDYKYQSNIYLTGHRLHIIKRTDHITLKSYDGDLQTNVNIVVKKIIYNETPLTKGILGENSQNDNEALETFVNQKSSNSSSSNEILHFDYHDAPIYPIPDNIFNLSISDDYKNDLKVLYEIKNDSFRKFSAELPEMYFEEIRTVRMSCFEPMLLNDIIIKNKDYYEVDIDVPIEEYEFYFKVLQGIHFTSYSIEYLDGSSVLLKSFPGKKSEFEIILDEDGTETIHFIMKKPTVGKTIILRYEVTVDKTLPDSSDSYDFFRAGLNIYNLLSKEQDKRWKIENNDGTILIIPV